ncbi:MAG: hypothetical protein J0L92_24050 [Deltaproteobacteria bacterium]|nr:hypothetical protein [Deltaproteobacteria bacterium]
MRVYADGTADMVLRPGFLDIYPRGGAPRRIAWEEPPKKGGLGLPRRRVLAVAHGSHAWIGEGRGVRVVPLDVEDVRDTKPLGVRVLDATSLGEGRVLVCAHLEGDEGAWLRVVDGRTPDLAAAKPLALPEPKKVEWPAGSVWKAGKETWPEKAKGADKAKLFASIAPGHPQKDGGSFFDSVVLTKSPHGIAGASVQNGVIFFVAADGSRIEGALRVPTNEDATIHPVRTAEGVLVTIVVNAKESALLHLSLDGRVLAHRSKIGKSVAQAMSPPMLFGSSVLVFDRSSDPVLLELGLSDLEIKGKHGLPGLGAGEASIAFASDSVLVSDGEAALRVTLVSGAPNVDLLEAVGGTTAAKTKKKADDDLGLDDEEESDSESEDDDEDEPVAPIIPASRPRATGAPSLTLAEAASPSVWALASGATLNVVVGFANLGGVSKGVFVEVAGQAVLSGLVAAGDVRIGSTSTKLEKKGASFRAEVPTIDLSAGLLPDPDEKRGKQPLYEGIHRANVTLDGLKPGAGLVTVRIGPLKAEPGRGSIVQGKTITVR